MTPYPLRLVPPDPGWPEAYAREAAALRSALGARIVDLQHVGSTAVPGLNSKPLIDIAMAVNSEEAANEVLAFRDALGADGELVVAYAKEKQRVAALVGWDKVRYSVEKGPFIRWPDERPELRTTASRPAAVTLSCDNHRLVSFP